MTASLDGQFGLKQSRSLSSESPSLFLQLEKDVRSFWAKDNSRTGGKQEDNALAGLPGLTIADSNSGKLSSFRTDNQAGYADVRGDKVQSARTGDACSDGRSLARGLEDAMKKGGDSFVHAVKDFQQTLAGMSQADRQKTMHNVLDQLQNDFRKDFKGTTAEANKAITEARSWFAGYVDSGKAPSSIWIPPVNPTDPNGQGPDRNPYDPKNGNKQEKTNRPGYDKEGNPEDKVDIDWGKIGRYALVGLAIIGTVVAVGAVVAQPELAPALLPFIRGAVVLAGV